MDNFSTSYFGYPTYEEYYQKRSDSLSGNGHADFRQTLPTKEEHDAAIIASMERHCGIVISEHNFAQGSVGMIRRQWRHEHPLIFVRLPAEVQEWIRTKTLPMEPIYG